MSWEYIIDKAIASQQEIIIPCSTKKQQLSIRSQLFRDKRKKPSIISDILRITYGGLEEDNDLYVKVYLQILPEAFIKEADGSLTPIQMKTPRIESDKERLLRLMKEDGISEEEIKSNMEGGENNDGE